MSEFPKPKPLTLIELLWYKLRKLPFIIALCKNKQCSLVGVAYPYPHWDLTEDVCPICEQQLVYKKEIELFLNASINEKDDT